MTRTPDEIFPEPQWSQPPQEAAPGEYEVLRPLPRGHRRGIIVSWIIILVVTGLIVLSQLAPGEEDLVPGSSPPAGANHAVEMATRMAVGGLHLTNDPQVAEAMGILAPDPDDAAATPHDRLRIVPALAEIRGEKAAIERLDELIEHEPAVAEDARRLRTLYIDGPDALSPGNRERIRGQLGWLGELALTHGLPDDSPQRRAVLAPAKRAFIALMVIGLLILGGLVMGLGLLILATVKYFTGTLRSRHPPPAAPGPFVESFAVYLVGFIGLSLLIPLIAQYYPTLAWTWALTIMLPIAILWPRWRGLSAAEVRHGFGLHSGRGWLREMGAGIVGYIAGLPILAVGFVITIFLASLTNAQPTHPIIEQIELSGPRIVVLLITAALWAPVTEEIMFRGALFHHLRGYLHWLAAGLIVALIFAAVHPQGWTTIPALGAIAVVLAGLREWRGSIIAPITAHALHNGMLIVLMLMTLA